MKMRGTAVISGIQLVAIGAFFSVAANAAQNTGVAKKASAKKVVVKKAKKPGMKLASATATLPATSAQPALSPQTIVAAPGQSSAAADIVAPSVSNRISLKLDSSAYGPRVSNPGNKVLPTDMGADDSAFVSVDNSLTGGYKLNDKTSVSASLNFMWNATAAEKAGLNPDITLNDPSLKISRAKLISQGAFSFDIDGRAYLPFGDGTWAKKHQYLSLRSTQNASYELGRWTLGAATYVRWYGYGPGKESAGTNFKVYAGPNVNYQISPTVSAFVLYEMVGLHSQQTSFTNWSNGGTDLEPGVSWDVTKNINLSPYLNMYPGGKFLSLDTMTLNLLGTFRFL